MKKILLFTGCLCLLISCNKNQKVVKEIEGTWSQTGYIQIQENGDTIDLTGFGPATKWSFESCKLKKDEYCTITESVDYGGDIYAASFLYRIIHDGFRLELKAPSPGTISNIIDIEELNETTLILSEESDFDDVKIAITTWTKEE